MEVKQKDCEREAQPWPEDGFSQLIRLIVPYDGLFCVIVAYFDESGTHAQSPYMCVAGYLFSAARAEEFTRRWNKSLAKVGVGRFHMKELAFGRGQFKNVSEESRGALVRELIELIRDVALHGFVVRLSQKEFDEQAPPGWQEHYGGSYSACLLESIVLVSMWAQREGHPGPVAYVFESGHPDYKQANAVMARIIQDPEQKKAMLYRSHAFVDKGVEARPCEAADFLAWHIRKASDLPDPQKAIAEGRVPKPVKMREDLRALLDGRDRQYSFLRLTGDALKLHFASQKLPPD